ncbi:MAG: YbaK/EbsC family protein [Thermomicrobium sp.]|nr:YbaK/EbsC family protein [Thermomicrobium sp.]
MSTRTPGDLAAFLSRRAARARLLPAEQPTRTVEEAARALGVTPRQIIKSLLFCAEDGTCVLAIVRGDQRVDPARLRAACGGTPLKLAPARQVLAVTGYPAGATPPVGHSIPLRVLVDPAVLAEPLVYGGGGDERTMLEISPEEIVRLTEALVAAIAQPT